MSSETMDESMNVEPFYNFVIEKKGQFIQYESDTHKLVELKDIQSIPFTLSFDCMRISMN